MMDMDVATERMSAELADELAANNVRRPVDPRSVPIRFHHLRAMAQSGQHAFAAFQEGDRRESLPMRMGAGVHALLLGGREVVCFPGKVRNGKVWDAYRVEHAHDVILNRRELEKSTAIVNAIRSHHEASLLLFAPDVVYEQTIEWEQLGRARRTTPDVRGPHFVVELKTTKCAAPAKFNRDGLFRGYNAQVADQLLAARSLPGSKPSKAYIVAVESTPPYPVTVFEVSDRAIQKGEQLCRMWLEQLLVCEASNTWPGYCESMSIFDVPEDEVELIFADDAEDEAR